MDSTITRRPMGAMTSLAAVATAITLTAGAMAPPAPPLPSGSAPRISTQAVALAANPFEQLWAIATGADSNHPLPAGVNPIAPVTEQVVRSAAVYAQQLAAGQAQQIPAEIATQAANLADAAPEVAALLIEDVAIVPLAAFSAAFLTLLVIGSLPASASALASLPGIWVNAIAYPPLKWAYNGFAIRNTIAMALQPPALPQPAASTLASTEPEPGPAAETGPDPATEPAKVSGDSTGTEPRLRTWTKRLSRAERLITSAVPTTRKLSTTEKDAAVASDTAAPPASDTAEPPTSKDEDRSEADTGSTTKQHKSSHPGKHRSNQKTASKPAA